MITTLTGDNLGSIRNPAFAAYADLYRRIHDDFMAQVADTGVKISQDDPHVETEQVLNRLRALGATFRNGGRSIVANAISPACVACQTGEGSATFFISLQCHRDCYYCFNPNQVEYEHYRSNQRNPAQELAEGAEAGYRANYLALTGGEPLLHRAESLAFFNAARRHFPGAHTRLYTTGDHANEALLAELRDTGLAEIRFSIRMHDLARGHRHTLERIALARSYIPTVMVEMPVLPNSEAVMKEVLLELDEIGIHSINLLEFCYPLKNAEAFNRHGFQVKMRPYQTLYNYWYAGGVPIAGSELACLELLAFGLERQLALGLHYCSLENKLTGQNYQQNAGQSLPATHYFSRNDYLLKSAKVFGDDIPRVFSAFRRLGHRDFTQSRNPRFMEFHVSRIADLRELDVEIGLSTSTCEQREDGPVLRELKIDLVTPQLFDMSRDV